VRSLVDERVRGNDGNKIPWRTRFVETGQIHSRRYCEEVDTV
jgi:hypothetical protein